MLQAQQVELGSWQYVPATNNLRNKARMLLHNLSQQQLPALSAVYGVEREDDKG